MSVVNNCVFCRWTAERFEAFDEGVASDIENYISIMYAVKYYMSYDMICDLMCMKNGHQAGLSTVNDVRHVQ